MNAPDTLTAAAPARTPRRLGHFTLQRLLAKTVRTMVWLVAEPVHGRDWMLVIPRVKPEPGEGLAQWLDWARRCAKLKHPGLAPVERVDVAEGWPYVAHRQGPGAMASERIGPGGMPPREWVLGWMPALEGLACVHDAGLCHGDPHAGMLWVSESGACRWLGLGAALPPPDTGGSVAQRRRAERDVLAAGLVLHHALAGEPPLGDADAMAVAARLPPLGTETVRLARIEGPAMPDALRAIVHRATEREERRRFRSARSLARALAGWLQADGDNGEGPLALILDRLRIVGLLPASAGAVQRARHLQTLTHERMDALADIVLDDPGLVFELLRATNVAARRVGTRGGNGTLLTVHRAIAMLGLDGVQRAAHALKPWPGPLPEHHAAELAHQISLARQAGQVARWIRLPGYDGELVHVLALLQRLGRLVVQYHFPDEAAQIRRLMQAADMPGPGGSPEPGMAEQAAGWAVLGIDTDALGLAVARRWGFDGTALMMMRRQTLETAPHAPTNDPECLRLTASCANEVIDAQAGPAQWRAVAMAHVASRYGQLLGVTAQQLQHYAMGKAPEEPAPMAGFGAAKHAATAKATAA